MPQHPSKQRYNNTQKYFLFTNLLATVFWFFLLARLAILYPLLSARFLPSGIADFYLSVLITTVSLELFNYLTVFRHIPGTQTINNALPKPYLKTLILASISRLSVAFVLFNYPKIARSEAFALIILVQSIKELFRWFYNLQKVRLFNIIPKYVKSLRNLSYLLLTPIEIMASIYLIFQSLAYPPYQTELLPYDQNIKSFLKLLLLAYLPSFYLIYKRMISKYFFAYSSTPMNLPKPTEKLE